MYWQEKRENMAAKSKGNVSAYRHINKAKLLVCFLALLFSLQTALFAAPYSGDVDGLTLLIEFPDEPAIIPKAADAAESNTGSIRLTLSFKGGYNLAKEDAFDVIEMEDFALTSSPGDPMLPHKLYDILLPPDALESTVELNIVSAKTRTIDGTYSVKPAGPDVAWVDGKLVQIWGDNKTIVDDRNVAVYQSNADFPKSSVKLLPYSQMRKWKLIRVNFSPIQYNPVSGELTLTESIEVEISYQKSLAAMDVSLMADTVWDDIAARCFLNYEQFKDLYAPAMTIDDEPSPLTDDYVIITTNAIVANSTKLNDFVTHKQGLGHSVLVVTYEDDIQSLTGQSPNHRAEKIRQWLKNNYISMSIKYVLLIGDPCPYESGEGDIPMKMCYPRGASNDDDDHERAPTDYFYADLTGNWDFDGDEYYGEWDDDFGPVGGVDLTPEVYVGRIPVYDASYATLDSILQKMIDYAKEPNGLVGWRDNVLLPMGFQASGYDGAQLAEQMRDDYLISAGYSTWRMYQQGNGDCSLNSIYTSEEELRGGTYVRDRWATNEYGIVCWWAHGNSTTAVVGYSDCWDGTLMQSSYTSWLDDDYPAFTYQCSCTNGRPETSNNLQYAILKQGGIATVGATRVSWFNTSVEYGDFDGSTTNSGIGYEYVDRLVQDLCAGDALYQAKSSMSPEEATDLMNWYDFNLYGDPAMSLTMIGDMPVLYVDDGADDDPNWGDPSGSDPNEDGSFEHPYDSIQEAVDSANNDDIIIVLDGTYTGVGNYNIDTNGLAITIKSQSVPKKCIIDCQSNGRAFIFQKGEDANTVLDGFTITGGSSSENGGAIYCFQSSPVITDCIITGNYATWSGGAIFLEDNANALINQCTIITNNSGSAGGGIESYASNPTIKNCIITGNSGKYSGAITSSSGSNTAIINCTIANNSATNGPGGLECYNGGDVTVVNSTLWNNTGEQIDDGDGTASVTFSDVEMTDSNWPGNGNINDEPLFADANNEDYHLKSTGGRWSPIFDTNGDFNNDGIIDWCDLAVFVESWLDTGPSMPTDLYDSESVDFVDFAIFASCWHALGQNISGWVFIDPVTSPCIDAGDPSSDYSLEPAPNGGVINMGAYGNTEYASKSP